MRSKFILVGVVNVLIELILNVDLWMINNIVIKNYSLECLKEKELELKFVNLNLVLNVNVILDVKLEYLLLD